MAVFKSMFWNSNRTLIQIMFQLLKLEWNCGWTTEITEPNSVGSWFKLIERSDRFGFQNTDLNSNCGWYQVNLVVLFYLVCRGSSGPRNCLCVDAVGFGSYLHNLLVKSTFGNSIHGFIYWLPCFHFSFSFVFICFNSIL